MQSFLKQKQARTTISSAMETRDHSTNGANPKSQTSRKNFLTQGKMKKIFLILALFYAVPVMYGQGNSGLGFNYQAVIRNAYGFVLQDSAVTLKVSLYPGQQAVTPTWVETHNVRTDAFGTIGIRIGYGTRDDASLAALFSDVNFAAVYYWLKIEINEAGTFSDVSFTSLSSCPYCDVAHNASAVPAGIVMAFTGNNSKIPAGWMLCDGRELSRSQYANLYDAIGVEWGNGDNATTFNIPDMRGVFLRGVSYDSGNDPGADARIVLSNNGGNSGNNVGSYQSDAVPNITGTFGGGRMVWNSSADGAFDTFEWSGADRPGLGAAGVSSYFNFDASRSNSVYGRNNTTEVNPKNVYVNYIIKL